MGKVPDRNLGAIHVLLHVQPEPAEFGVWGMLQAPFREAHRKPRLCKDCGHRIPGLERSVYQPLLFDFLGLVLFGSAVCWARAGSHAVVVRGRSRFSSWQLALDRNTMKRTVTIISAIITLSFHVTFAATVSGRVTDAHGNPLPHASVQALERPKNQKSVGTVGSKLGDPWIHADDHGRFQLQLPPGRYKILAKAETDGYPDPQFRLNRDPTERFPEIEVQTKTVTNVRVVLGQRGGLIEGRVVDTVSGEPVPQALVQLVDPTDPHSVVGFTADASRHFHYTVLPKRIHISASATGYTPAAPPQELLLVPGETQQVKIALTRK